MSTDPAHDIIQQVDAQQMRADLYYLCDDPLPYRKLNYTLPGHDKSTLYEADDYIQNKLEGWGYTVEKDDTRVQAFRRDTDKRPVSSQYDAPAPEDPWYIAHNIYAKKAGSARPEEIIIAIAHKDSQSWIDSPGANDNAVGTVGVLELARVLADYPSQRSIWFIWCNEEHIPWTSVTAAQAARERGDNIIAVLNLDGIGRKSVQDVQAGRNVHVTVFTKPEGEAIADLMAQVSESYGIGLEHSKAGRERPGDDDGSFINAGYPAAVINIGSWPYGDPNYHTEGDIADTADIENAALSVQALSAAMVHLDRNGAA